MRSMITRNSNIPENDDPYKRPEQIEILRNAYATVASRVFICTRIWLHQRVVCTRSMYQSGTSRAVKFRPVASSFCFVASRGAATLFKRRWNEGTLWLTILSRNGQRPGGSATRRNIYSARRAYAQRVSIAIYETQTRTLLEFYLLPVISPTMPPRFDSQPGF